MSEKRFVYGRAFPINSDDLLPVITDNENDKDYFRMVDIVDVLNTQQATIEQLQEENKELVKNFTDLVEWASEIAKRNVLLDEKIGKLQRENKKLKEMNRQLREINKELGDDLHKLKNKLNEHL